MNAIFERSLTLQSFIKTVDALPFALKIIFCLFGLDVIWAIYRVIKGIDNKDTFLLIVGIVWLVGSLSITWIIDLVTVIINKGNPIFT